MIDTSNKEIQSHYELIVVGTGAAGSVIASELSASGAQVLLVESGGPEDAPTIRIRHRYVQDELQKWMACGPSPVVFSRWTQARHEPAPGRRQIPLYVWTPSLQRRRSPRHAVWSPQSWPARH
jgi:choline dehydrogenase-like flavoprotein